MSPHLLTLIVVIMFKKILYIRNNILFWKLQSSGFWIFDNIDILCYARTKSLLAISIDYLEALAVQASIQHTLLFKHPALYIERNNKIFIDSFNYQDFKDISIGVMEIICPLENLIHNFSIIYVRLIHLYYYNKITHNLIYQIKWREQWN